ncbi:DNA gyrase subunit A, partial [Candidatus Kaiserbacteria bacterium CG10_big_fil_rev_8_21_14_0_10_45_20]
MARKKEESEALPEKPEHINVVARSISTEMRESYLDYAMSVITSRALPDVRDGLKPVHRRILFSMHENGLSSSARFRKSAFIVGDVLGKYHPHGDTAVYDTLAKMAQDFTMRYPLVLGQGNFGSIDGDSPAAMRYTEAKMMQLSGEFLKDLEKETVSWRPNYDGTRKEPEVFPAAVPGLLLNGTLGIAVGMATNIPPHNLKELVDATVHIIDNPKATTEDLLEFVKGPDFPVGGIAYNQKDIAHAYATGRGGVVVRGDAEITEDKKGNPQIVITSIPFRVNKADLIVKIADLVREKKLEGIKDLRDESTRDIRVVIDLKSSAQPQAVLNYLYKHTQLEDTFHFNMVVLVDGVPETLSLSSVLSHFIEHRKDVVRKRTEFDLRKAKDREHILLGLKKALDHIDEIIKIIKASKDVPTAQVALMKKFKFSDKQATAILEMRLSKLAGLERKKIEDE